MSLNNRSYSFFSKETAQLNMVKGPPAVMFTDNFRFLKKNRRR